MKKLIIFFVGLLLCSPLFSQNSETKENDFSLGAQVRSRAEYRNGAQSPHADGADVAGFVNDRARLSMEYKRSNLSLGLAAQHVGVWGQDPQVVGNGSERFMLNEAWASLNSGTGFFLKFGRQSLVYDDERILGALDWNVSGRYHDALKLGYENPMNKLHLILAFNQTAEKTTGTFYPVVLQGAGQPYKTMQTLWYQHIGSKMFNASFLVMNIGTDAGHIASATDGPEKSEIKYLQTLGTNLSYQPDGLSLYGTFYYQSGKTASLTDKKVSAFMWAINASYAFTPTWKVLLASDYLSGNDGKDADKYKAFNPLYGTHHKFYGTMDYFYASAFINSNTNPGLWDNQIGLSFKASPKVTLALNYHYFSTTTDVYAGDDKLKRALGSEWDLQVNWNVMKDVAFTGGYSTMFGNDTMKAVKGGDPSKYQDWAWISLNINPKILITKW
ncbi:MAG: alginate export family protein [Candidatus Azobacteroides sp.]|nr:alginate export family protein [Candidatus Azobacteroides sp.]